MNKRDIARLAYEVNRAYCAALGIISQPPWEEAPGGLQNSIMKAVDLRLAAPEAGPEASHEAWMAEKEAEGWAFGLVKDEENKTHPCMVPFADLPKEQQAKDYIFMAVVKAMAPALEEKAAKKVVARGVADMVGVKYVGNRETHYDNLYATNLTWTPGQTHNVPAKTAELMLLHADVYERATTVDGEVVVAPANEEEEQAAPPNKMPIPLPNLDGMSKAEMQDFAQMHYGEKLHHAMSEANMRSKILGIIQERGR